MKNVRYRKRSLQYSTVQYKTRYCVLEMLMEFDSLNDDSKVKYSAIDSLLCKYSSSSLKYFNLPYLKNIYNKLNNDNVNNSNTNSRVQINHTIIRKSPIIHRGYYVRHHSFTKVLSEFIKLTRSKDDISYNNNNNNNNISDNNNGNSCNPPISQIIYLGNCMQLVLLSYSFHKCNHYYTVSDGCTS